MDNAIGFSLFIAVNALLLLALAANVSRHRVRANVSLGDGGDDSLRAAIRAHSNGIEQVPIFALVILVLTLQAVTDLSLAVLTIGFSIARLLHAIGMLNNWVPARRLGAGLSYLFQLLAAGFIFWTLGLNALAGA